MDRFYFTMEYIKFNLSNIFIFIVATKKLKKRQKHINLWYKKTAGETFCN